MFISLLAEEKYISNLDHYWTKQAIRLIYDIIIAQELFFKTFYADLNHTHTFVRT